MNAGRAIMLHHKVNSHSSVMHYVVNPPSTFPQHYLLLHHCGPSGELSGGSSQQVSGQLTNGRCNAPSGGSLDTSLDQSFSQDASLNSRPLGYTPHDRSQYLAASAPGSRIVSRAPSPSSEIRYLVPTATLDKLFEEEGRKNGFEVSHGRHVSDTTNSE